MFFARFPLAVGMLAIAGSLAAKKHVPPFGRHAADAHAAVHRAARDHRRDRRCADLPAGAGARADRRTPGDARTLTGPCLSQRYQTMTTHHQTRALDPKLLMPAIGDAFRKLSPRAQFRNPVMFVVFVCSILTTLLWMQALGWTRRGAGGLHPRGSPVAVVHAAVREFRRSDRRRPRQGTGRLAAQRAHAMSSRTRFTRPTDASRSPSRPRIDLRKGDLVLVRGRRIHPWRRRRRRGRGDRRRKRGDRRIRAGDPRIRRRPQLGHRRHARAVGLADRAHRAAILARASSTA